MLAVSDVVYQALIGAVVTIVMAALQVWSKLSADKNAREASDKTEEVKETLEKATTENSSQLQDIAKVGALTHELVNSASLIQLGMYRDARREIANLTKKAADIKLADDADVKYQQHAKKAAAAAAASPTLIVEDGKVVMDDQERTPIVVEGKQKTRIVADDKDKEK